MDQLYVLTCLNAAMSLIYSAVFAAFWFYHRPNRYLLVLSGAFLSLTACFVLMALTPSIGPSFARAVANLLGLLAVVGLTVAVCQRAGVSFPLRTVGFVFAATMALYLWFVWVQPDLVKRIYALNTGISMLLLATVWATFNRGRNTADRVLSALLVAYAILSIARPVLSLPLNAAANDETILVVYWTVFCLSHAIMLMLIVFALTGAVTIDAISVLRNATNTDPLSGLMNRRGFEASVLQHIERARQRKLPVSLVLCDLDHFKSINDTFGHHIGDQVIAIFAKVMKDVVGDAHVAGRIGGEEFAIFAQAAMPGSQN